jgi:hypothetical protein
LSTTGPGRELPTPAAAAGADLRYQLLEAYAQKGRGSSFSRATIIAAKVYDRDAPIPSVLASPDQNSFMADVAQVLTDVAGELGFSLE